MCTIIIIIIIIIVRALALDETNLVATQTCARALAQPASFAEDDMLSPNGVDVWPRCHKRPPLCLSTPARSCPRFYRRQLPVSLALLALDLRLGGALDGHWHRAAIEFWDNPQASVHTSKCPSGRPEFGIKHLQGLAHQPVLQDGPEGVVGGILSLPCNSYLHTPLSEILEHVINIAPIGMMRDNIHLLI